MTDPYDAKRHYQQETVAGDYDRARFAGLRGWLVNWLEQRLLMKAMAGVPAGAKVLDLPVGTGRMARRLNTAGYRAIGTDVSEPMLRISAELAGGRADLVRGDGEALPYRDGAFQAAVCFRLLVHLPEGARKNVLRELARVASGRVVAVYQPHRLSLWWLVYGLLLRRKVPLHFVAPGDLEREFESCGLRLVRSHALLRGFFMERAYVLEPIVEA